MWFRGFKCSIAVFNAEVRLVGSTQCAPFGVQAEEGGDGGNHSSRVMGALWERFPDSGAHPRVIAWRLMGDMGWMK